MSMSVSSFGYATILPFHKEHKARLRLEIRAHGLQDEGRWSNLVDSNMKLLKERMEVMRAKERLERNHKRPYGWDYASSSNYINKPKKHPQYYLQTLGLLFSIFTLPILIGTTLVYIFSVIAHLNV